MRFVDSRCIHCGATLRVAGDATHVCCQYCNAELHVVHDGDRVTTELVREMHDDLSQKLDVLRVQNEVERLDREWNMERENYMVTEKGGGRSVPSVAGSVIGCIVAVGFGIFWISGVSSAGAPGFFVLFGVIFVVVALFATINGIAKASGHSSAEQRYQSDRRRLMNDLRRVEQDARSDQRRRK